MCSVDLDLLSDSINKGEKLPSNIDINQLRYILFDREGGFPSTENCKTPFKLYEKGKHTEHFTRHEGISTVLKQKLINIFRTGSEWVPVDPVTILTCCQNYIDLNGEAREKMLAAIFNCALAKVLGEDFWTFTEFPLMNTTKSNIPDVQTFQKNFFLPVKEKVATKFNVIGEYKKGFDKINEGITQLIKNTVIKVMEENKENQNLLLNGVMRYGFVVAFRGDSDDNESLRYQFISIYMKFFDPDGIQSLIVPVRKDDTYFFESKTKLEVTLDNKDELKLFSKGNEELCLIQVAYDVIARGVSVFQCLSTIKSFLLAIAGNNGNETITIKNSEYLDCFMVYNDKAYKENKRKLEELKRANFPEEPISIINFFSVFSSIKAAYYLKKYVHGNIRVNNMHYNEDHFQVTLTDFIHTGVEWKTKYKDSAPHVKERHPECSESVPYKIEHDLYSLIFIILTGLVVGETPIQVPPKIFPYIEEKIQATSNKLMANQSLFYSLTKMGKTHPQRKKTIQTLFEEIEKFFSENSNLKFKFNKDNYINKFQFIESENRYGVYYTNPVRQNESAAMRIYLRRRMIADVLLKFSEKSTLHNQFSSLLYNCAKSIKLMGEKPETVFSEAGLGINFDDNLSTKELKTDLKTKIKKLVNEKKIAVKLLKILFSTELDTVVDRLVKSVVQSIKTSGKTPQEEFDSIGLCIKFDNLETDEQRLKNEMRRRRMIADVLLKFSKKSTLHKQFRSLLYNCAESIKLVGEPKKVFSEAGLGINFDDSLSTKKLKTDLKTNINKLVDEKKMAVNLLESLFSTELDTVVNGYVKLVAQSIKTSGKTPQEEFDSIGLCISFDNLKTDEQKLRNEMEKIFTRKRKDRTTCVTKSKKQ